VTLGEGAPQRALGALQAPAGRVDVQRVGAPDAVQQIAVGLGERLAGRGEDHVDRAGRDLDANSCSHSSTTSRREMRLRTIAACNRGPNALAAISAGSTAVTVTAQPGQRTRWH
jgi:hypothetical protein